MLKIYGIKTLNTAKVILTAEAMKLPYEFIQVDLPAGEHKTPEFLARNPMGRVPVIEDDGKFLYESNAICRYLAESQASSLYAGDSFNRAVINQWVDTMALHLGRWVTACFFEEFIRPAFFGGTPDPKALEEAAGYLKTQMPVLDEQLRKHPYIAGAQLTIADTIGFAYIHTHEFSSVTLDEYSNIQRWYSAIRASDFFTRAEPMINPSK